MLESPSILVMVFAFLLVLGPLVLVHELGHYLVGRMFGIKADAFSIGFGKELVGWTDQRGTRWKISALPLGGYVQFAGDLNATSQPDGKGLEGLSGEERGHVFHAKPLWQKSLVVLAGPLTNLVVAIGIFAAFNMATGKPIGEPVVLGFTERSDAKAAGLKVGDRIVAVSGAPIQSFTDIAEHVLPFPGDTVPVTVRRDGRELVVPVSLEPEKVADQFGNESTIGNLGIDFLPSVIGTMTSNSAAKAAGLEVGDRIIAVDGVAVTRFSELPDLIGTKADKPIALSVLRGEERLTFRVVPEAETGKDAAGRTVTVGRVGIGPGFVEVVPVGPLEAVVMATDQSIGMVKTMVAGIKQIVTGQRSVKELGGPVKIAKFSGERFSLGWPEFVYFAALISINLAFINLLPIPALDGGHLAFYAAEAIRRKPLGARSQEWAFRTGMAFVLALMLFVTINDLASLLRIGG